MNEATGRLRFVVPALAMLAAIPLVLAAFSDLPGQLDRPLYDEAVATVLDRAPAHPDLVFVDIDDDSLQDLGHRWPISRLTWTRIIRNLGAAKPAAIALDAFFPQPNNRSDVELALDAADRIRDAGLADLDEGEDVANWLEKQAGFRDADRQLATAIADAGNVVLGLVDTHHKMFGGDAPLLVGVPGTVTPDVDIRAMDTPQGSLAALADAAASQASLYVPYDSDGMMRRYHYLYRSKNKPVASLALAALQAAYPERAETFGRRAQALPAATSLVRFPDPSKIKRVRLSDVLAEDVNVDALKAGLGGKVLFVGVSAIGAADNRATPIDPQLPGTLIHIAAAADLLTGTIHTATGNLHRTIGLVAVILCLFVVYGARRINNSAATSAAGLVFLIAWTLAARALFDQGIVVPVTPAWIAVLVPITGDVIVRALTAEAGRQQIRQAFGHYLDPTVVEELVNDPDSLRLGGERREITAFFSDVAGFTSISEALDPADLVRLLNEYLSAMTHVIIDEGGSIDKYVGDAVVAMFGAPHPYDDHAERACRAALRCRVELERLRPTWVEAGYPEIHARIGLNTGTAVVGNMGSQGRFDYTMMGDTVNLAARLEGANKQYGTLVMCGEKTAAEAGDSIVLRELDTVAVKGKDEGVRVFEVVHERSAVTAADRDRLQDYSTGLAAWRAGNWQDARAAFAKAATVGDAPSRVFLERLDALSEAAPAEWDGIYRMKTK